MQNRSACYTIRQTERRVATAERYSNKTFTIFSLLLSLSTLHRLLYAQSLCHLPRSHPASCFFLYSSYPKGGECDPGWSSYADKPPLKAQHCRRRRRRSHSPARCRRTCRQGTPLQRKKALFSLSFSARNSYFASLSVQEPLSIVSGVSGV